MEKTSEIAAGGGGSHRKASILKKSFKLGLRSLLTTSSLNPLEFSKAFPEFTNAEQERLHRLFIQVITSLHGNIEDGFESLCDETQVGTILDTVEQVVEEQSLDPLYPDKTNVGDVGRSLSAVKKNEIQHLTNLLEKAEEQKRMIGARIELLKSKRQDFSGSMDAVEKVGHRTQKDMETMEKERKTGEDSLMEEALRDMETERLDDFDVLIPLPPPPGPIPPCAIKFMPTPSLNPNFTSTGCTPNASTPPNALKNKTPRKTARKSVK